MNSRASRSTELPSPAQALAGWLPSLVAAYRGDVALLGESLLQLQRGLTSDRRLSGRSGGAGYMDSPDLLGAYLLYYWPVSYLETFLSLRFGDFRARRILDLGSGPGPAAAACADAAGATQLVLEDGSPSALGLARILLANKIAVQTRVVDFEKPDPVDAEAFDAIVASHLLNELWKSEPNRVELRVAFIEAQSRQLAPEGFLLVIEPATLVASRELLALRDALAARGWRIHAPCPSSLPCPILAAGEGRSCHGEAAWSVPEPMASLAARAGLDRASVKWSFFIASPPARPAPAKPQDAASTYEYRGRVVSEGLLNKAGRLRFALCSDGTLLSLSAKAGSPIAQGTGFARLRRYDLVGIGGVERREGGLGLVEGSSLTTVSAPLISVEKKVGPNPKGRSGQAHARRPRKDTP